MSISMQNPRMVAYFTGYQKIENPQEFPFNPNEAQIPDFIGAIDVIPLAFVLVKNGTIEYTCPPNETSLCNGPGYWTLAQIKDWLVRVKTKFPHIKFTLSIGGWAFNDWASITDTKQFASNIISSVDQNWKAVLNGQVVNIIDGLDIDYETGSGNTTPLQESITFNSLISDLITAMNVGWAGSPILSLPYYGGSPWSPADLQGLANNITFISTMGYGEGVYYYNNLKNLGFNAIKGFSFQQDLNTVKSTISTNGLTNGMFWNLCRVNNSFNGTVTPQQYIAAMDASLPKKS